NPIHQRRSGTGGGVEWLNEQRTAVVGADPEPARHFGEAHGGGAPRGVIEVVVEAEDVLGLAQGEGLVASEARRDGGGVRQVGLPPRLCPARAERFVTVAAESGEGAIQGTAPAFLPLPGTARHRPGTTGTDEQFAAPGRVREHARAVRVGALESGWRG